MTSNLQPVYVRCLIFSAHKESCAVKINDCNFKDHPWRPWRTASAFAFRCSVNARCLLHSVSNILLFIPLNISRPHNNVWQFQYFFTQTMCHSNQQVYGLLLEKLIQPNNCQVHLALFYCTQWHKSINVAWKLNVTYKQMKADNLTTLTLTLFKRRI